MPEEDEKITVRSKGLNLLRGEIPLLRKSQVISEHGEPLSWQEEGSIGPMRPIVSAGVDSPAQNPSATTPTPPCNLKAHNRPTPDR